MGIYIRGMTMPKECRKCVFTNYRWCGEIWCRASGELLADNYKPIPYDENERPEWCPLVEIKVPHGRLIDELEAYDKIGEQEGGNYIDMDGVDIGLQETPTVIEQEDE